LAFGQLDLRPDNSAITKQNLPATHNGHWPLSMAKAKAKAKLALLGHEFKLAANENCCACHELSQAAARFRQTSSLSAPKLNGRPQTWKGKAAADKWSG